MDSLKCHISEVKSCFKLHIFILTSRFIENSSFKLHNIYLKINCTEHHLLFIMTVHSEHNFICNQILKFNRYEVFIKNCSNVTSIWLLNANWLPKWIERMPFASAPEKWNRNSQYAKFLWFNEYKERMS